MKSGEFESENFMSARLWRDCLAGKPVSVVLADQVRSLDWRVRNAKFKGKVTPVELETIRWYVRLLIW